jgi:hypothetical protein
MLKMKLEGMTGTNCCFWRYTVHGVDAEEGIKKPADTKAGDSSFFVSG